MEYGLHCNSSNILTTKRIPETETFEKEKKLIDYLQNDTYLNYIHTIIMIKNHIIHFEKKSLTMHSNASK